MDSRIWTISNIISGFRIVLLIPLVLLLLAENPDLRWYTIGLMVLIASTDLFDGYIARRFHQVSEIGKILDPIADKIAIGVVCFIFTIQNKIPSYFFIAVLLRDVIIFLGGLYIKKSKGTVPQSNQIGKWTVTIIALYLILVTLDYSQYVLVKDILLYLCYILLIISFISYTIRFNKLLKVPPTITN